MKTRTSIIADETLQEAVNSVPIGEAVQGRLVATLPGAGWPWK